MKYNINDYIKVRLTDEGRRIHRAHHAEIVSALPEKIRHSHLIQYSPPIEDELGWSTWQGWNLMQVFGPYMGLSAKLPFDTVIDIIPANKGSNQHVV